MGILGLLTPRYDYASAAAAEHAYAATASRRRDTRMALLGMIPQLVFLPLSTIFLFDDAGDPDARPLARFFGPLNGALLLLLLALISVHVARVWHSRTMAGAAAGSGADRWYEATVTNVAREGRLLWRAALASLAVTAVAGTGGLVLLGHFMQGSIGWDAVVTLLLPALALSLTAAALGRRRMRQPQRQLHLPRATLRTPVGWQGAAGIAAVVVGALLGVFGDTVLGYRTYTEVVDGVGQPGVEFPVVVARVWVLPYLGGLLTILGWSLIIDRLDGTRARVAVAVTAALGTVWVAAATNPANHDAAAFLWSGIQPVALLALAGRRSRQQTSTPGNPNTDHHP
ncbi:hypothetical protein COUCH_11515 [Couchioplanes caeruleus]|uniref:hypothetical protein n=1 Tax=Couchioplanes caeruleus TaxID=56438 RepID=UPI0020C11C2B|nr:hypothetical protein [Couchioplanes caeruleus]UQU66850.1 hypothetical protein COUCH_11515 [Couchioplanes caeruleus]